MKTKKLTRRRQDTHVLPLGLVGAELTRREPPDGPFLHYSASHGCCLFAFSRRSLTDGPNHTIELFSSIFLFLSLFSFFSLSRTDVAEETASLLVSSSSF